MTDSDPARQHFACLDRQQQAQAIGRLAAIGYSEYGISHATALSVEMIRRILAERGEVTP